MRTLVALLSCTIPLATLSSCGNPFEFNAYEEYQFEVGQTAFLAEGLQDVCLLPGGEILCVTCPQADLVYFVSTDDLEIDGYVTVTDPHSVCALQDGGIVYVSSPSTNSVALLDADSYSYVLTIGVGESPMGICLIPNGEYAYVANNGDSTITVIRTMTAQVVDTIYCDPYPFGICADPYGEFVFCSVSDSQAVEPDESRLQVVRVSDNTLTAQLPVGQDCRGIACGQYGECTAEEDRQIVLADVGLDRMTVLAFDTTGIIDSQSISLAAPFDVVVHPDGWCCFGTASGSGSVKAFYNFPVVEESFMVEPTPTGICSDESGDHIYIVHDSGFVTVINRQ